MFVCWSGMLISVRQELRLADQERQSSDRHCAIRSCAMCRRCGSSRCRTRAGHGNGGTCWIWDAHRRALRMSLRLRAPIAGRSTGAPDHSEHKYGFKLDVADSWVAELSHAVVLAQNFVIAIVGILSNYKTWRTLTEEPNRSDDRWPLFRTLRVEGCDTTQPDCRVAHVPVFRNILNDQWYRVHLGSIGARRRGSAGRGSNRRNAGRAHHPQRPGLWNDEQAAWALQPKRSRTPERCRASRSAMPVARPAPTGHGKGTTT